MKNAQNEWLTQQVNDGLKLTKVVTLTLTLTLNDGLKLTKVVILILTLLLVVPLCSPKLYSSTDDDASHNPNPKYDSDSSLNPSRNPNPTSLNPSRNPNPTPKEPHPHKTSCRRRCFR